MALNIQKPQFTQFGLDSKSYLSNKEQAGILSEKLQKIASSDWIEGLLTTVIGIASLVSVLSLLDLSLNLVAFVVSILIAIIFYIFFKKYSKLKEGKMRELESQLERVRNRTSPYETAIAEYYNVILDNFYRSSIYKKHSGTETFSSALTEFSAMLEEAIKVNEQLLCPRIKVADYERYIIKRRIDHIYATNDKNKSESKRTSSVNTFTSGLNVSITAQDSPERRYSKPRKIEDWEKLYAQNLKTGEMGEYIALNIERDYLRSINQIDLAERVRHISKEDGDGFGYDILSYFENGLEKYIEVKTTTTANLNSPRFSISANELNFLEKNLDSSFVYLVSISTEIPTVEVKTASEVLAGQITPVSYKVKM